MSMYAFYKAVVFVLLCVFAILGLGAALLLDKEGLPGSLFYFGGALFFLVLFYGWFWLYRREQGEQARGKALYYLGVAVIVAPFAYYLYHGLLGSVQAARIAIYTDSLAITNYQESLIAWPGIEAPVGVRLEFDLQHRLHPPGYFRSPRLLIGDQARGPLANAAQAYWEYCTEPLVDGIACMMAPLWPISSQPALAQGNVTHLSFDIYPSNLYYFESPDRLCLRRRFPYAKAGVEGEAAAALWHFAAGNENIELSQLLSDTLDNHSQLFTELKDVRPMFARFQYEALEAAGYEACEIKNAIRFSDQGECFCRL